MRGVGVALLSSLLLGLGGCASGSGGPPVSLDGGGMDSSFDAQVDGGDREDDAGTDAGRDGGMDAGPDGARPDGGSMEAGMQEPVGTCEPCETTDDCRDFSFCVGLSQGGRACLPSCGGEFPDCPRGFSCVLMSGVDTSVCAPVGDSCCVDEDADKYGQGVGCMGDDCNDEEPSVNPGETERCNGVDDDCNMETDEPPTDCVGGRCTAKGDGTYESIQDATCSDDMCAQGTLTDCGLFTCEDGGENGTQCATSCTNESGTDDDSFCIDSAHCDDGTCEEDQPNGGQCDEDSDCSSGHCDNGFCCDEGKCCSEASDCGDPDQAVCNSTETCQGMRGSVSCTNNQCQSEGTEDDSACTADTKVTLDCGLFKPDPAFCTGAVDQSEPTCPDTCSLDGDCVDGAHCEQGSCVPDRSQGGSCQRPGECKSDLFCVDGVCCNSECNGTCEACNLSSGDREPGTCSSIPAGNDPAGECPGFSCQQYYAGFDASDPDICYHREDVSDAEAGCNGMGACVDAATQCPMQPKDQVQIDCNDDCQSPDNNTCTGMTAGVCQDLDDPSDQRCCGVGQCEVCVQRCTGGELTSCSPDSPSPEACNNLDDDCDGMVDNASDDSMCSTSSGGSLPDGISSSNCVSGTCEIDNCETDRFDVDEDFSTGCECSDDNSPNACSAANTIASISTTSSSQTVDGTIEPGEQDCYAVEFPDEGRGPGNGQPHISLTGSTAANFVLDLMRTCGSPVACDESGDGTGRGEWSFVDNQSSGTNAYSGPHNVSWASRIVFCVRYTAGETDSCSQRDYTVSMER